MNRPTMGTMPKKVTWEKHTNFLDIRVVSCHDKSVPNPLTSVRVHSKCCVVILAIVEKANDCRPTRIAIFGICFAPSFLDADANQGSKEVRHDAIHKISAFPLCDRHHVVAC